MKAYILQASSRLAGRAFLFEVRVSSIVGWREVDIRSLVEGDGSESHKASALDSSRGIGLGRGWGELEEGDDDTALGDEGGGHPLEQV